MKKNAIGVFGVLIALMIGAFVPSSAQAQLCVDDISLTADCYSYKITIDADVNMAYLPTIVVTYSLRLVDGDGVVAEIGDSFPITPAEAEFVYEHTADWGVELCGEYAVDGELTIARPDGYVKWAEILDSVVLDCPCDPPACIGTGTPGYWKNHPEAWPGDVMIGGVPYTIENAIYWMKKSKKKDKTFTMYNALVAAKLNVAIGNEAGCILATIHAADEWMAANGPVGSGVKAGGKDSPWREGEQLAKMLDKYNNGLLCAQSRDLCDEPPQQAGCGCEGKVTQLTLQYHGGSDAFVEIVQKKPQDTVFAGTVSPGGEFTFIGSDKKGTLGTEISVFVDGVLNTKIHTSCSQPIGPGMTFGDFMVKEGYSREAGLLCRVRERCAKCDKGVGKLAQQSVEELGAAPTLQNYPNPFNPVTTIAFNMPKAEKATLTVYNILGEKIATLADGYYAAGQHSVTWNATGMASGIYFYRFEAGSFEITNKLLFAK